MYSVDIDHLKNIPITQVAEQLNIDIDRSRRCFCPDPECPDSRSKHRGASVNIKRNNIHCFVCGRTFNPWTLTATTVFGMNPREAYTKDSIVTIGRYLGEDLGYGGVGQEPREERETFPKMPVLHFTANPSEPVPLYRVLGLMSNPARLVRLKDVWDGHEETVTLQMPECEAAAFLFERCMDTIERIYDNREDIRSSAPDELMTETYRHNAYLDDQQAIHAIQRYMKQLYPYLNPEDKETLTARLLMAMIMTDHPEYRDYIRHGYEEQTMPFIRRLEEFLDSISYSYSNANLREDEERE